VVIAMTDHPSLPKDLFVALCRIVSSNDNPWPTSEA